MKKIFAALCLMLTVVCSSWAAKKEKKLKTAEMDAKEFSLETACKKKWDLVTLRNVMFTASKNPEGNQFNIDCRSRSALQKRIALENSSLENCCKRRDARK